MTHLLKDILRQPAQLAKILAYSAGPGRAALESAARITTAAEHLYVTGIGSSWNAGIAVAARFNAAGRPCHLVDASELLYFSRIPPRSAIVVLSRSGRSFEIVRLLAKAQEAGAKVIGVTNTAACPLAEQAHVILRLNAEFDHLVSVSMYSGLLMVGGLLASVAGNSLDGELCRELDLMLSSVAGSLEHWCSQIQASDWLAPAAMPYFLARGGSLASCHEARLLWEEAANTPASAITTGGFRHGSQEAIKEGFRLGLWIDHEQMRDEDLALADDIRACGGKTFVIGQNVSASCGDLVISLPPLLGIWQPLIDVIPAQIAAEHLSRLNGEDCDSFRFCSYIVATAGGLHDQ